MARSKNRPGGNKPLGELVHPGKKKLLQTQTKGFELFFDDQEFVDQAANDDYDLLAFSCRGRKSGIPGSALVF